MQKEGEPKTPPGYLARGWGVVWGVVCFFVRRAWGILWYFLDKLIVALIALGMFAGLIVLVLYAFFPEATVAVLWQGPAVVSAVLARITWADIEMLGGMVAAIAGRILKRSDAE